MTKYEHMTAAIRAVDLAALGMEGWMVAAVHDGVVFLQREFVPPAAPVVDPAIEAARVAEEERVAREEEAARLAREEAARQQAVSMETARENPSLV